MKKFLTVTNASGETCQIVRIQDGHISTANLDGDGDIISTFRYFTLAGEKCEELLNELSVPGFGLVRLPDQNQ